MPQVQKVRGQNTLVIQLTNPDNYGFALYKVIKNNGRPTNVTQKMHIRNIESAQKPQPSARQTFNLPPDPSCPDCGTHPRMGYQKGVNCPNCDYVESFKDWLNRMS